MDKENFGLQITDEDIEWVRTIMPDIELDECRIQILKNMNSVDIHACPGSGKTTILVAKLAILSRKWKWQNRGICVLSHTNVAREKTIILSAFYRDISSFFGYIYCNAFFEKLWLSGKYN